MRKIESISETFREYSDRANLVRRYMFQEAQVIVERNLRKFKKGAFPIFVYEPRKIPDIGTFQIVAIAETKSRFQMGIVGVCAFQILESVSDYPDVLLIDGDDNGGVFFEMITGELLSSFARIRSYEDLKVKALFIRYIREKYYSRRLFMNDNNNACSYGLSITDNHCTGGQFGVLFVSSVSSTGASIGICSEDESGFVYFDYMPAEEFFKESPKKYESHINNLIEYWTDMEVNPMKYSPLGKIG